MSSPADTTSGPSDIGAEAKRTDVTDAGELREELLRIAEDGDADDYEMMEKRLSGLLSDTRRAIADQSGGDDA